MMMIHIGIDSYDDDADTDGANDDFGFSNFDIIRFIILICNYTSC